MLRLSETHRTAESCSTAEPTPSTAILATTTQTRFTGTPCDVLSRRTDADIGRRALSGGTCRVFLYGRGRAISAAAGARSGASHCAKDRPCDPRITLTGESKRAVEGLPVRRPRFPPPTLLGAAAAATSSWVVGRAQGGAGRAPEGGAAAAGHGRGRRRRR